jgi:hypothetical protein
MPYNGSGTFTPYTPGNPVTTGTTISSSWANNSFTDFATGLSTAITKDAQTTTTARIPFAAGASMGSQTITAVAAGTATTHAATVGQLQSGAITTIGTIAGTNTITAVGSPVVAAYASGQSFEFTPANANTAATTINIDGLGAKNIFSAGVALIGGELLAGVPVRIKYDGTQFNLLTPAVYAGTTASTFTFNGSGGSTGSLTLTYQKIGKWVTLNLPTAQATSGTGSTNLQSNTAIPAAIRPTASQDCPCNDIHNNGGASSDAGVIRVLNTGVIQVFTNAAGAAFTNSTVCGTNQNVSVTYFIG